MSEAPVQTDIASNTELKTLGAAILNRFSRGLPSVSGARAILGYRILRPSSLPELGLLALLSALCGTGIVYVLNKEAALVQDRQFAVGFALLFVAILLAYRVSQKVLITRTSSAIEQALDEWRCRISRKVTGLSLRDTEELSRGRILDGLARSYEQVSQTIVPLVAGGRVDYPGCVYVGIFVQPVDFGRPDDDCRYCKLSDWLSWHRSIAAAINAGGRLC